ncbi:S-type anion channel SLAH2-like [Cornus florida]|uniref:S-type anion channel SLAH2-like n=1 Tax=Cornus florida TaxID=4283 RepID=UPI00289C613A|nr:S-type anion channel SLAH2-like [Cornus florida]XP_059667147.1 S-type anion channel SLAH2-like [Cornus florida]XP_059667148.1 S-type anion channel SLAH2-like [Cornus florida]XP_059667149.1 S-type anion channel SLAH2-like [Cornus florida]XP_059667150.1 S-type anion channel SLAH2-like [Cornus florida]
MMENSKHQGLAEQDSPEVVPSLIKFVNANEVAGFDSVKGQSCLNNQFQPNGFHSFSLSAAGTGAEISERQTDLSQHQGMHSVSLSMPFSPMDVHLQNSKSVPFNDYETIFNNDIENSSVSSNTAGSKVANQAKILSESITTGSAFDEAVRNGKFPHRPKLPPRNPRADRLKDNRFDSFKTWSGKRQLSKRESGSEANMSQNVEKKILPADRYFDALEGPELDTLRPSEEILLPDDKQWPFLLRFPISSFGICLGISSQAIMWKMLAISASMKFLHVSLYVNLILWCISVALVAIVSFIYSLKVIFYFEAFRREYYHPVRVNFFFAPWIAFLFVALGVPPYVTQNLHAALWYILMIPILCLDLKIYGQWMSGGQRRLSKVANPSNHLAIVGNFVGALLGASMGLKEGPLFFFAVGLAHYTVLFVTLYQRLPTNETLPKELHPVFFLFVAAPSVASMAWANLQGSFDYGSRIAYFIALFLYFSLVVRVNFFRGFRFSLAWWAYTFPMTGAAISTIKYTNEVTNIVTKCLSVVLCIVATLTVTALLVTTIFHAIVLRDLFPNDIAIAISDRRQKTSRKWYHRRTGSSDTKDVDNYLKFADPDSKDIEAALKSPSSSTKKVCISGPTEVNNNHSHCVPTP